TIVVLDEALAQCGAWRRENRNVSVSVNISTTNLLEPGFPRQVQKLLEQHALRPEVLVLEITETTAMEEIDQCKKAIQELRDLGVTVSVDDFGAGFTSLAYLSSLAVNELKLDRSFINGLAAQDSSKDLALLGSTIRLAHALGLRVVAEGVEDKASLELLAGLGCDLAQGYLISKPQRPSDLRLQPYRASSAYRAAGGQAQDRAAEHHPQWVQRPLPSSGNA